MDKAQLRVHLCLQVFMRQEEHDTTYCVLARALHCSGEQETDDQAVRVRLWVAPTSVSHSTGRTAKQQKLQAQQPTSEDLCLRLYLCFTAASNSTTANPMADRQLRDKKRARKD